MSHVDRLAKNGPLVRLMEVQVSERDRVDAMRNTQSILEAADELLRSSESLEDVTMSGVAARAKVGKGTVYRAYADKAALLKAVMAQRSAPLREAIASSDGDLGASRPPEERLIAVLGALTRFKLDNRLLSSALEQLGSGSPYDAATYGWWHSLISEIIHDTTDEVDVSYLAHLLLAGVRSDLLEHLLTGGLRPADIIADVEATARSLIGSIARRTRN